MIRAQGLVYAYPGGGDIAFPDVDLAQGNVLLLRGPSGCGKSTWLALIAALMQPKQGLLMVADQVVQDLSARAADAWRARAIGFLPQKLHLSAALTVEQNLAMAQWAAGQTHDARRIEAALATLGVADLATRRPGALSGGQAQRVALARAVLLQPRVILADEPTASLDDDAAAASVKLLLNTASNHNASLVIATHDTRVDGLLAQPMGVGKSGSLQRLQLTKLQSASQKVYA